MFGGEKGQKGQMLVDICIILKIVSNGVKNGDKAKVVFRYVAKNAAQFVDGALFN